jgi:hypothetical protein
MAKTGGEAVYVPHPSGDQAPSGWGTRLSVFALRKTSNSNSKGKSEIRGFFAALRMTNVVKHSE